MDKPTRTDCSRWMDEIIHPLDSLLADFVDTHADKQVRILIDSAPAGSTLFDKLTDKKFVCSNSNLPGQQFDLVISWWPLKYKCIKRNSYFRKFNALLDTVVLGGSLLLLTPGLVDINGKLVRTRHAMSMHDLRGWLLNRFKYFRKIEVIGLKYQSLNVSIACKKVWC